jgi:hypothetical protein
MLPSILIKTTINSIPLALAVYCAKKGHDRLSHWLLTACRKYSSLHSSIEKGISHGISAVLHPVRSFKNWRKNRKVIKFLRQHARPQSEVQYQHLPSNLRFAIQKEGAWEVYLQMLSMFSVLPTIRHVFINNPFLFEYQMHLTNQTSPEFADQEKMCQILFSYVNDPAFIFQYDPCRKVDQVQFSPNYHNDPTDYVVDHNQIGLQISTYFSTLVYLDTLNKSGTGLHQDLINHDNDPCLMHREHPIYSQLEQSDLTMWNRIDFDPDPRVKLLEVMIPYDHHYHLVSGIVEGNIRNGNRIEHPMLCLYNSGYVTRRFWNAINSVFQDNVLIYLKKLEEVDQPTKKKRRKRRKTHRLKEEL